MYTECSCLACQGSRAGLLCAMLLGIDALCCGTATKREARRSPAARSYLCMLLEDHNTGRAI